MSFLPKKLLKYFAFNCQPWTQYTVYKWTAKPEKMKTAKYTDAEALFVEQFLQKQVVNLLFVIWKIIVFCSWLW